MALIRAATLSLGTSGTASSIKVTDTNCVIVGIAIDYSASADAGTVFTLVDGTGATVASITGNTDIGATVPARLFGNGRLIAGTSTSNVAASPSAFRGFTVNATLDVAGPQVVRVWWRPMRVINTDVITTGADANAAGGAPIVAGGIPGIFHAARVIHQEVASASTKDITFYDGTSTSGRALTTLANSATNWTTDAGTTANRNVVVTTNRDEGLASLTTAANAHENDGVPFLNGLFVGVAQGNAAAPSCTVEAMVEL